MCVCSNSFSAPIMHHNARSHAGTKWKLDLPITLYIYILIWETCCFRSLTSSSSLGIILLNCVLYVAENREGRIFPPSLISYSKSSSKPINHGCIQAQRSAASPHLVQFTSKDHTQESHSIQVSQERIQMLALYLYILYPSASVWPN